MAKMHVLNKHASIIRRRKGVYHLFLSSVGRPGPDGEPVLITCVLRGELPEMTPTAVVAFIQSQKASPGVLIREGPIELASGNIIVEGTCRKPPGELAVVVAILLGVLIATATTKFEPSAIAGGSDFEFSNDASSTYGRRE